MTEILTRIAIDEIDPTAPDAIFLIKRKLRERKMTQTQRGNATNVLLNLLAQRETARLLTDCLKDIFQQIEMAFTKE